MKSVKIDSIESVEKFVNILTNYDCDLVSDRYVIDAKSIMGIFIKEGFDITTPIVITNTDNYSRIINVKPGLVKINDEIMLLEGQY